MNLSVILTLSLVLITGCNGSPSKVINNVSNDSKASIKEISVSGVVRLSGVCGNVATDDPNRRLDCDTPFSTMLTIHSLEDNTIVKVLNVGEDGKFSVDLLPGKYTAVTPKKAVIGASRTEFTVGQSMQLPIRILVSAGIR